MKSKKNIVFLGMMGSGKSSIGFLVSKRLQIDFVDIDDYIEQNLGMKISEIFKSKGESFFRQIEEKITLKILKRNNIVISLGGGSFLNKNIRKEVLINHLSFWLKLNSQTLISRIINNKKRPLAIGATEEQLNNMIKKRSNIYSKALFKVNCNGLTKAEVVKKVINIYENKKIIS